MADQNIRIKLFLDKSPAEKADKEYHAGTRTRIKQSESEFKKSEKAKRDYQDYLAKDAIREAVKQLKEIEAAQKKSLKEQVENDRKAFAEIVKIGKQAAKEKAAEERKSLADAMKMARERVAEERKILREIVAEARKAAREKASEERKSLREKVAEERRSLRESASEARKAARELLAQSREKAKAEKEYARDVAKAEAEGKKAALKMLADITKATRASVAESRKIGKEAALDDKKAIQARKDGLNAYHKSAIWYANENRKKLDEQADAAKKLDGRFVDGIKTLGTFALGMAGISTASSVFSEISANFQRIKQNALDATGVLQGYREALKELAALKGNTGNTGKEMVSDLQFRAQTAQTRDASIAFQSAAIGSGEGIIDTNDIKKNISPEEFKKSLVFGGKLQTVTNGSPDVLGEVMGNMPRLMGGRQDAASVANQVSRVYELLKPGSSSLASGFRQFNEAAPYISNGILSIEEAASMQAGYSNINKDGAATMVDQAVRATTGSITRNRKVRGIEGANNAGTAKYLRGIGATVGMKPFEMLKLMKADIAAQQAKAKAEGREFNPASYLTGKGYGNQEDMMAVLGFNVEGWDKTFAPKMADKDLGKKGMADVEARLAHDPSSVARRADITDELGQMAPGIGKEGINSYYRAAYNKLKVGNQNFAAAPKFDEVRTQTGFNPNEMYFANMLQTEFSNILEGEAGRVGVPSGRRTTRTGAYGAASTEIKQNYSDEEAMGLLEDIQRKGGGTLEDLLKKLTDQTALMLKNSNVVTNIAVDNHGKKPIGAGNPAGQAARVP